ncbi:D-alanyl-D-alanine carboxypeptidase [Candidatus Gottesmanbacteria bacterium]|nr:D-alanyl-D-alanine carboxypeptidase [Candidatus Gottesmanbacteria bacterium]
MKKNKKRADKSFHSRYILLSLKIALFAFLLALFPGFKLYEYSISNDQYQPEEIKIAATPTPYPQNTRNIPAPYLTAEGVYVLDLPSGTILYQKNPDIRLSPASTTKIVTALVAFDYFKLEDILTVNKIDPREASMGLRVGEKITFESLLYGLLVASANDASLTIAENYPGGITKFIEAMNQKAATLSLINTRFTNPMGFDDTNHYTTAKELASLAKLALQNKNIGKIVATRSITVSDTSYTYFHELHNVNQLLGGIPGVAGIKTGFTENAEECLVTLVKRNNTAILVVLLKSQDRFGETANLINWVFNNHTWVNGASSPVE